jgi:hypothetical protein
MKRMVLPSHHEYNLVFFLISLGISILWGILVSHNLTCPLKLAQAEV